MSVTGVAGLTLGGGLGVMMRAHGLSCDNLRSVEIVTADGMVRTASRDEHADLFWALRGGGRGLGVVTSLEFDLHPLGPDVAAALVLYPYDDAATVLRAWRDAARQAPDTVAPRSGCGASPRCPTSPPSCTARRSYSSPASTSDRPATPAPSSPRCSSSARRWPT